MGVAAHLGIRLREYDARIRTFIPHYEEMLDAAAAVAATGAPQIAPAVVATPIEPSHATKTRVRVLRVVRRGKTLVVQGRITGPARLRAFVECA
jgi:hypothetical protein